VEEDCFFRYDRFYRGVIGYLSTRY